MRHDTPTVSVKVALSRTGIDISSYKLFHMDQQQAASKAKVMGITYLQGISTSFTT